MKKSLLVLAATAAIIATAGPAYATNTPLCHKVDATTYELLHLSKENAYNLHYLIHPDDVIPPFTFQGQTYSLNWDADGQALYENGCVLQPSPSPSPSGGPTPSPSPSASPSPSTSPSPTETPSTSVAPAHSSTPPPGAPSSPGQVLPFTGGHVPMWMLAAIGGLLFVGTLVLRVTTRSKGKHVA